MSSDLSSRCAAVEALEARRLLATVPSGFSDAGFATGFTAATSMAFAPDGRLFVTQQGGQVRVVKNGQHLGAPFLSVSTDSAGERGLLGLAFDPQFSTNRFVYVYYTVSTTPKHNRVSRFTAALNSNGTIADTAVPGSEQVILSLDGLSTATNHNGGAIHFGPDSKLYVAVGDAANGANAQSLSTRHGKVLRINKDGTIPTDNPFYNSTTGVNRAIWALGLRNPYTFSFKPGSSRMFINDVGSSKFEEINDGLPARNYGWPQTEGFFNQASFPAFTNPIHAYARGSGAGQGFAITGGTFYNPPTQQFPFSFVGDYFFSDFGTGWIRTLDPAGNATAHFAGNISAPVDLDVGPDGALYYLERGAGRVGRISHNAATAAVVDFEPAAVGEISSGIYVEDGFRFSNLPGRGGSSLEPLRVYGPAQGYSSKVLHPVNFGRRIDVVRENGASFDLTSFDYAAGRWGHAGDLIVTGTFTGGSTQSKTVSFTSRSLTKLPLAWTGLTKVSVNWSGGANEVYGAVDNFVFGGPAAPYRFDGNRVVLEAEHHDTNLPRSGHAWTPFNDGTFVGGGLQATPADAARTTGTAGPELQYRIDFPAAGSYRVWLRGKGTAGDFLHTDSAWIGLNGQSTNQGVTRFAAGSTPTWTNYEPADGVATLSVPSPGVHTLNIWMREAGFMLDRMLLTSDTAFVPTGNGPPESGRG